MSETEFIRLEELGPQYLEGLAVRLAGIDPWRRLDYLPKTLEKVLSETGCGRRGYLIRADGRDAGVLVTRSPWWKGVYLELLAVFPEMQRCGIGKSALRFMETVLGQGLPNIWLLVSGFNAEAQAFYLKNGFLQVARIPDLLQEGEEEVLMRKSLPVAAV